MSEVRVSDPRIVLCAHCMEVEKMIGPPNVDYVDATVEWDHGDGDRGSYTFTNPETGLVMQVPETDPVMEDFVGRHQHGREPKDVIESIHVWTTDMATFVKMDVMQVVKEGLQKQQNMVVEETNGLKDDALKCYNAHGNPDLKKGCRDFRDDSKRIGTSKLPKEQQVHLCLFCLDGSTEVVTRQGLRQIRDLAGTTAEVLRPPKRGQWGAWEEVSFHSYGVDDVHDIVLSRGRERMTIQATPTHRWSVGRKFCTTAELRAGDTLDSCYAAPLSFTGETPSPQGIQHGIVYGDGTRGMGMRPAYVTLHGEDKFDLSKWFPLNRLQPVALGDSYTEEQALNVVDLPKAWKLAPSFEESRSYLLGFLAGYFAADGSVSPNGQATLESADYESAQLVRGICHVLGVSVGQVQDRKRIGIDGKLDTLYRVTLRASDLPDTFWLKSKHRRRRVGRSAQKRLDWKVVSVSTIPVATVEVFCAVVPEVERFTLAGNLVSGNCPYAQTYIAQELRWKVGAYGNKVRRKRKTVDTNVSIGPRAAAALGGKGGNRRARRKKR